MPAVSDAPVLLYDGDCNLCNRALQFVLNHDRKQTIRFGALDGEYGRRVRERHPFTAAVDSIVWLEMVDGHERVWVKSNAALRVAAYLGGVFKLAAVLRWVPRMVRDRVYDLIAARRTKWFGRASSCVLPTAEQRARMLP